MSLMKDQPLFNASTQYRIEVQGHVDVDWLLTFDRSVEIAMDTGGQQEGVTVLAVRTDQAGIVGLVRRLHGLGVAIQQLQVIS
jgi:hypothetical protein